MQLSSLHSSASRTQPLKANVLFQGYKNSNNQPSYSPALALQDKFVSSAKSIKPQVKFGAWNDVHSGVATSLDRPDDEKFLKALRNASREALNEQDDEGHTPLSIAAGYGYDRIVKVLLGKEGIDPNIANFAGKKPKQIADELHYPTVVKEFTEKGF